MHKNICLSETSILGSREHPCKTRKEALSIVQDSYGDSNTFTSFTYQPSSQGCIDIGVYYLNKGVLHRVLVYLVRKS